MKYKIRSEVEQANKNEEPFVSVIHNADLDEIPKIEQQYKNLGQPFKITVEHEV